MNEKLLQYLWNFKIFKSFEFKDVDGHDVEILDFGKWNFDSGPDFLNGKIKYNGLIMAGHIELHVKSSDYIFHRHSGNPEFENLILHVVYDHNMEVPELSSRHIPTLELRSFIDESILWKYETMIYNDRFIACETLFDADKIPFGFTEETLFKKLDEKSVETEKALHHTRNDYEAVLFHQLAYAFGLKVNAPVFRQMAEQLDFGMIQKIRQNRLQLEALFYGTCGWLDNPADEQMKIWKREYDFLKTKYRYSEVRVHPKFSKLRPPNFPTIRLAQLAALYHRHQNLFSKIIAARRISDIEKLFEGITAGEYWNHRFNFGKTSPVHSEKSLTPEFINLVILNAVLPLKYTYHKKTDEHVADDIAALYREIPAEKNTVTAGWKQLGTPITNALDSQAYIYHYKNFCEVKNCLNCSIGYQLLKRI
ncbi:DUF2851 family protein [Chryseobacterium sp. MFBS3-17]|uniref:DUF2851 family protein n=1 Tax=Chryseobacterium sp. MFBS3-17 TaxID=2886689 RepID=UPI001D0DC5A0|nr:DUF2851 family protein [Chryseobacterium sp. MFBS3-17]MCC2589565.1 DUF2851 family protein [Chryseobacterium sp. MFBS3-17]